MTIRDSLVVAVLIPLVASCATKRDLQDLRGEMQEQRASQEMVLEEIREQSERTLETLRSQDTRLRGDLANQFREVEQQLVQVLELTGVGQQRISDLRQQLAERGPILSSGDPREDGEDDAASPPVPSDASADELYETSLSTLRRGSLATARAGFQEFLQRFPDHRLAADAQFYIGESHAESGNAEPALDAYARVLELYPDSERVPAALYRAGLIELELGNQEDARALFRQVVSGFPDSDEAILAQERLDEG